MRTFQLRRYQLDPALAQDFIAWVNQEVIPIRQAMGYQVEWKYFSEELSEFVWLVSLTGTVSEFEAMDQQYLSSEARAKAAAKMPKALVQSSVSFVTAV